MDPAMKAELKRAKYAAVSSQTKEPQDAPALPSVTSTQPQLSREELKQKLHAKIEALSAQRKSNKPQPESREALIRRTQEAALDQKAEKKRAKKQAKKATKAVEVDVAPAAKASTSAPSKSKPKQVEEEDARVELPELPPVEAPEPDLQFSSLDFTADSTIQPVDVLPSDARGKRKRKRSAKDPQAALEKIEARKAFLEKLTPQAQERAQDKDKWASVEARAKGEKVMDDEGKLKKMVKRQEKQKLKSKKAWCVLDSLHSSRM
jgi:hypothetical protein